MSQDARLFEPTETVIERIVFAMEDQSRSKLIDLATGELVERPDGAIPDRYALPPDWTPAEGFKLMESFCDRVMDVEAKRALLQALSKGKGVFKAFRAALAEFPEEEARFKKYKYKLFGRKIRAWMEEMRESLGLSRLGPEPEELDELLDEEFSIEAIPLAELSDSLAGFVEDASAEAADGLRGLPAAAAYLERDETLAFLRRHSGDGMAFAVRDREGQPIAAAAGAVIAVSGSRLAFIRFVYAAQEFRALGLEQRLLEKAGDWFMAGGAEHCLFRSLLIDAGLAESLVASGCIRAGAQLLLR